MYMEGWLRKWMSWGFLTIAIVIHAVFISSLGTGMLNSLFYDTNYLVGQGADFFSYYQAGHNVLNGLDCYTIPDSLVVPYLYPYRYLPYFAYSFGVILNLAPPLLAYWLWVGVLTVAMWLAVLRTRSLAKALHRPDWEGRIAMGMWFVFSPIYIELFVGQVTLFAAILMFFALTTPSLVDGRKTRRGTMTSLWTAGSLIKIIPFFIAPVLLGAGRVRSVIAAVLVTVLAIVAVPAGLESLQFFLGFNISRATNLSPYVGSHSLKMLLYYLLGGPITNSTVVTGTLIGVFFVLAIGATLYSRDVWASAGLFSTTYFFIMVDVWEHHYTFILPLLVLAWIRGRPEDKARWVPFVLVLLLSVPIMPIISFLSGSGPGVHPITWSLVWQIIYHSSKVVPALIFFGWLLVTAFRSP
ncbi:MAG: DUF2029 domain-containing protein, partial [Candidatus Thorarchaeota archaeon]|nr:DUF2029 domain-containing protein [Candidatus Thorarchaeota archaeon]